MAQKSLGFVHLIWTCAFCQTQNPGPIKSCTSCGAPQPPDVLFEKVDEERFEFIKDEALIRMAKAGPDKHCPYCGTRNVSQAERCVKCGSDISIDAQVRMSGEKIEDRGKTPSPTPAPPQKLSKGCLIALIIMVVIGCIIGSIFLFNMLSTDTVTAAVSSVNWSRSTVIESYTSVRAEGWYDEIPNDVDVGACREQYRYTSESPKPRSTEVCGEPYTKDTGTGIGEVVQDCVYQVYDDYCEYTGMAWVVADTLTLTGSDLQPRWPSASLSSTQRLGEQNETYTIVFTGSGERYTYTTTNPDLYQLAEIGSRWELAVNKLGAVTSAEPAN